MRMVRWLAALLCAATPLLAQADSTLRIHFFDVGQGDAALIESPTGRRILIDAGPAGNRVIGRLKSLGVDTIDLVIASHNHADHVGSMASVLRTFVVRRYIDNAMVQTTRTYESIVNELERKHIEVLKPTARQIGIGGGATIRILPSPADATTQNNRSVGVMLDYLDFRALFTGDAEDHERAFWRDSAGLRAVDVLKVAHHGSINGTDSAFLKAVRPCIAIISVARKNSFGHPSPDVLRLLASSGVVVHRTDREGEITLTVVAGRLRALSTSRGTALALPTCTSR